MSKKKNMYKLESLARLISGRTPEREQKEYYAETGTPWVKIENLDQGYIREASEYLSEQGKEKVNLVPENSVLFSIVGTVGKVGIAGRELATNQQIVSLIFDALFRTQATEEETEDFPLILIHFGGGYLSRSLWS